jgi:hypothetical protein
MLVLVMKFFLGKTTHGTDREGGFMTLINRDLGRLLMRIVGCEMIDTLNIEKMK